MLIEAAKLVQKLYVQEITPKLNYFRVAMPVKKA
jgi:hypothetical protein